MKITKKPQNTITIEEAHGGSGSRKLLMNDNEMNNIHGATHGFLPAGSKFAWHNHDGVNEMMYVIAGHGTVRDDDGTYDYEVGDVFLYPAGVFHEIENSSDGESEFIFVRVYE